MLADPDDCDVEELKAEARLARAFSQRLLRHPDCRDPDHPGCELCDTVTNDVTTIGRSSPRHAGSIVEWQK